MNTDKFKKLEDAAAAMHDAKNTVNDMSYDSFKQSDAYEGLKKSFTRQGQQAMKDTIGQVAARTGGMASSYATAVAQQGFNDYMLRLEDAARSVYNDEYSNAMDRHDIAAREYTTAYTEDRNAKSDNENAKLNAQNDVMTIWANGGEPDEELLRAAGFLGDSPAAGMRAQGDSLPLTALGEAYKRQSDVKNYIYPKTAAGKEGIVNELLRSPGLSLGKEGQRNFDYLYGDGAYESVQSALGNLDGYYSRATLSPNPDADTFKKHLEMWIEETSKAVPGLTSTQLIEMVENRCPEFLEQIDVPSKDIPFEVPELKTPFGSGLPQR